MLAGSWARRKRLWACSRHRPSSCAPGRRQTSLGAIEAFTSGYARWLKAHSMSLAPCNVSMTRRGCALCVASYS